MAELHKEIDTPHPDFLKLLLLLLLLLYRVSAHTGAHSPIRPFLPKQLSLNTLHTAPHHNTRSQDTTSLTASPCSPFPSLLLEAARPVTRAPFQAGDCPTTLALLASSPLEAEQRAVGSCHVPV